jgi:ABC-2 type transport system ATP-binding protein
MEQQEMIKVTGLSKSYGRMRALDDVSFSLSEGDLFGFIGPNGAGKTTTLRIMATTLSFDRGEVVISGHSLAKEPDAVRGIIGFMPDFLGIYDDLIVSDYLEFFARAYHLPAHMRNYAIKEVATVTRIEELLDHPVESLSRGMKQRLGLAKTLIHNPRVLLLDEPAAGLDPRARIELRDVIKGLQKQGRTIIISSHILSDLADLCNKVGIIEKGRMMLTETMDGLMSRISMKKRMRLRMLRQGEDARIMLNEHPKVSEIQWDGEDLIFSFSGDGAASADLLRSLMEKEIPVYFFGEVAATLESMYMKVTEVLGVQSN